MNRALVFVCAFQVAIVAAYFGAFLLIRRESRAMRAEMRRMSADGERHLQAVAAAQAQLSASLLLLRGVEGPS